MQKQRFLIFISKTMCWIKKFQIRKRCTSTRRAITYFLFHICMHFDFLLIIGKVIFQYKRGVPLFDPGIEMYQNTHSLILHSFFVTISPKTQRISFHNHHIRLIWLRVTSGYSPNSKDHSEDTVLTRLTWYKPNRRRFWRQFWKSNLTIVSTIEKNVGISALYREVITSKGMKLIWINR